MSVLTFGLHPCQLQFQSAILESNHIHPLQSFNYEVSGVSVDAFQEFSKEQYQPPNSRSVFVMWKLIMWPPLKWSGEVQQGALSHPTTQTQQEEMDLTLHQLDLAGGYDSTSPVGGRDAFLIPTTGQQLSQWKASTLQTPSLFQWAFSL